MLAKRLIPCLDVKNGRVVKGVNFVGLRDAGDPVEVAARYDAQGADELCFLDITASHEGRPTILDVVHRTAEQCFCPLTVGGGVTSIEDIRALLREGADKVAINSAALKDPDLLSRGADAFGAQCIVLAIDAKRAPLAPPLTEPLTPDPSPPRGEGRTAAWHVFIHGGRIDTGRDAVAWAEEGVRRGAGEILVTSMDADGTQAGYDLELTRMLSERVGVPVIASGGAGNLEHLLQALTEGKADAALAASIFHYGTHTLAEAKQFLKKHGVAVREV
ncbi:MAG TPA: imidazole glycerol phosphate synthase subunit HisF [Planctomycetota bacterium]|nr:imidazole glycerol phosphate synthase subunit HisF [Planctomycetota bacterium]